MHTNIGNSETLVNVFTSFMLRMEQLFLLINQCEQRLTLSNYNPRFSEYLDFKKLYQIMLEFTFGTN